MGRPRIYYDSRHATIRWLYDLTEDELETLRQRHMDSDGDIRCAICESPIPGGRGKKESPTQGFQIDHCHATKVVRGLLCTRCNSGLQKFLDDPILLRMAAHYLEMGGYVPQIIRMYPMRDGGGGT